MFVGHYKLSNSPTFQLHSDVQHGNGKGSRQQGADKARNHIQFPGP